MKIMKHTELDDKFFSYLEIDEMGTVKEIIAEIKKNGDRAVTKYTAMFDKVELENFQVQPDELQHAYAQLDRASLEALEIASGNIERFAIRQRDQFKNFEYEIQPGVFTGQRVIPIERVAVYTPGGRFPLPSTVLMCCIPAKIAGVEEIVLCSPPTYNGSIHPAILAAAKICDVEEIYRIGGVQAVAAMACGTETIKRVDKIVGPGNKYVTAAKKIVYGAVGIDFIAGPTEVLIIADDTANPVFIAADLLAQAEHDTNASPLLMTNSIHLAEQVNQEIEKQLVTLKTSEIARQAIDNNGVIIIVDKLNEAISLANKKAPEHLELQVANPEMYINLLKNYGTLFIGEHAAEALGDYSSGLNHTLPTNTSARYTGGLNVRDFLKMQTTLRVAQHGLQEIGPAAVTLGQIEGLHGHAHSIEIRFK